MAASSAASRRGRLAPPHALPSSALARAPHSLGPVRNTILHLSLPQIFMATSSALVCVSSFELRPYFSLLSSRASAPFPANAGAAAMVVAHRRHAAINIMRRIEPFSLH